ncbi:uncharacterized protein LOC144579428 [Callithrix jacchus]
MTPSVSSPRHGLASWETSSSPAHIPRYLRTKPPGFTPRHRGRDARGERLQALGHGPRPWPRLLGAKLGLRVRPARGRHLTRPYSSAGTRLPRRRRKEAPRRQFLHTHVPLVCAPPACRCYQAGAAGISGRPHPPRPLSLAPCIQSPWRLCCSIQDQAPPLRASLPSTPEGCCREASPPARVPRSPFLLDRGVQALHWGC